MKIPRFDKTVGHETVVHTLRETGCAIIERLLSPELMDRISNELEPYFEKWDFGSGTFKPTRTKKMSRLAVKSPTSHEAITHPLILDVVGQLLRDEAYTFVMLFSEANRLYPGEKTQPLHRDDVVYPFKHPCPPLMCSVVWALNDFTAKNGATTAAPGSHRWDDERKATPDELVPAEMPKGSAFVFDSSVYHGHGENSTEDQLRPSIIITYGVGWLRAIENPTLAAPPAVAKNMSKKMQELLGYRSHGYLGCYEFQSPEIVLQEQDFVKSDRVNLLEDFKDRRIRLR